MARPIKETPTLYTQDAAQFKRQISSPVQIKTDRLREMLRNYNAIKALTTPAQ